MTHRNFTHLIETTAILYVKSRTPSEGEAPALTPAELGELFTNVLDQYSATWDRMQNDDGYRETVLTYLSTLLYRRAIDRTAEQPRPRKT